MEGALSHLRRPPFLLLLLLLLLLPSVCTSSPSAVGGDAVAWSHDPEWYNEAQLPSSATPTTGGAAGRFPTRSPITAHLIISLAKALLPTHRRSPPHYHFTLPHKYHAAAASSSSSSSSSSHHASPEWFLVHDPEFFNEYLALPQPHPLSSRRLLRKPYHLRARNIMVTTSPFSSTPFFEWFTTTTSRLWKTHVKSD